MTSSYLNNDFKVTIKSLEDTRPKQQQQQLSHLHSSSALNCNENLKASFNSPKGYNVYNFDDIEYTHVTNFKNNKNTLKQKFDESKQATINSQTKILSTNSSSSNNASSNTNNANAVLNTHSINNLNSSDTYSSFNTSAKDNMSENNGYKNVFYVAPQNDSSSLIIDLNGSRRSNASCSNATRSSCSGSHGPHGQLNLYDCNSMLEQFNNDFNSFKKCGSVVPAPASFSTQFNPNRSSTSMKNNVELIVKDDSSNCNDIQLLQHLLDKFENFYTTPSNNTILNNGL
jgi:hypothetical protein